MSHLSEVCCVKVLQRYNMVVERMFGFIFIVMLVNSCITSVESSITERFLCMSELEKNVTVSLNVV